MIHRNETTPADWQGFDRVSLAALRMCDAPMLSRVIGIGIQPAAASAAFRLSASLNELVVEPVAWRAIDGSYGLMVRDRMGRLWIGRLERVDGSRSGWLFSTTDGPFDPDLDGDQVDPRHLKFERVRLVGMAA